MEESLGHQFVQALASRDADRMAALCDPAVDFKGLTPGRFWEASSPDEVVDVVLGHWFEESDHVDAVLSVEDIDPVEDTRRVGYRLRITNPDGPHVVEQQAYYRAQDGALSYLRVVCSGFRPCAE